MAGIFLAYFASWQPCNLAQIPAEKLSHLCYAFACVHEHQVGLTPSFSSDQDTKELARQQGILSQLLTLKQRNPDLKILVSIGGWGADGFSDAALTAASREQFARSAVQFMLDYQLDGIDLDWEYPGNDMASIKARPEDQQNFSLLLEALRAQLDAQSERDGRASSAPYQLCIAAGAGQYYLDKVEIRRVAAACDFINLMTYDFYNGWASRAGHHANLFNSAVDPAGDSAAKSIDLFVNEGVPRDKLVLGCPLYGRSLKGVASPGLGQPGLAGSNSAPSFRQISAELLPSGRFVRRWDADAQAPYLYDGDEFISYEDCESIALKGRYAKAQKLAGVMFWELTEDHDSRLLDALYESTR